MKYRLRRPVTVGRQFREISKDDFNEWRSTQKKLLAVFNIEVTFDLLIENYAEFERDLLSLGLRIALFGERGEPLETYREVNRRVANLLSSARLYLDQIPQELNTIHGKKSKQADSFKECTSRQYDSSLAYRVMEALRNHSQHFGFPVHAAAHSLAWENTNADSRLRAGLDLFVSVQNVKENRKFNKKVLDELAAVAEKGHVNLTRLVREYVEKLCEVHKFLRSLISDDIASWDQTILRAQSLAHATFGEGLYSIVVTVEEEDDEGNDIWVDSESINVDLIEFRKSLEAKNRDFTNLSALYVSGR
jgi:hypothetical protein